MGKKRKKAQIHGNSLLKATLEFMVKCLVFCPPWYVARGSGPVLACFCAGICEGLCWRKEGYSACCNPIVHVCEIEKYQGTAERAKPSLISASGYLGFEQICFVWNKETNYSSQHRDRIRGVCTILPVLASWSSTSVSKAYLIIKPSSKGQMYQCSSGWRVQGSPSQPSCNRMPSLPTPGRQADLYGSSFSSV